MFPLHDPLDDVLREELSPYGELLAALLARRGITTRADAEIFLNPSYDEHLHDPLLMTDMEKAARRLATAIQSKEKIVVWSDYDCDGVPGGVVMHDFLAKVGANFENYIPHRHDDGYGMNINGVGALARDSARLIVTVDAGITDREPIARARAQGIEVIVTDHHLPSSDGLPDAYAVVNPAARPRGEIASLTRNSANEAYPFHDLCGAAVAWKLACATLAIGPALRAHVPEGWEKWLLDMVGLATIADMVPLVGENRVLATYGLLVLRKSPRLGLQKLLRLLRINQRALTEDDISFMVAPRINAASRMGDARDALRLFTTEDEAEAEELARALEHANRLRKAEVGAITRTVHARLKEREQIRTVIAMGDPEWRPALLGLVAGTIADEYERPVFLWGREGNGSYKGSVRSGGGTHALELMRAANGTFVEFGGHVAAGGFTVASDAIFFLEDQLILALRSLSEEGEVLSQDTLETRADAAVGVEEITDAFLAKLEQLAPFGEGNPKPVLLLRDVLVREVSRFGKAHEHLRITLAAPHTTVTLSAIAFFAKRALADPLEASGPNDRIHLLAHLERDTFSRGNPVRLRLLDIKVS